MPQFRLSQCPEGAQTVRGFRFEGRYHKAPPPTIPPDPRACQEWESRVRTICTPPKPPRPARGGRRRPRPVPRVPLKSPRWGKRRRSAPGRPPPRTLVPRAFLGVAIRPRPAGPTHVPPRSGCRATRRAAECAGYRNRRELAQPSRAIATVASYRNRRELSQPSRAIATVASYRNRRALAQPSRAIATVASYRNRRELSQPSRAIATVASEEEQRR